MSTRLKRVALHTLGCKLNFAETDTLARRFEEAGYELPKIVFWNLNAKDNVPAKFDASGVALISGFSPQIMAAVLGGDTEKFTPEAIMMKALMVPRYDL